MKGVLSRVGDAAVTVRKEALELLIELLSDEQRRADTRFRSDVFMRLVRAFFLWGRRRGRRPRGRPRFRSPPSFAPARLRCSRMRCPAHLRRRACFPHLTSHPYPLPLPAPPPQMGRVLDEDEKVRTLVAKAITAAWFQDSAQEARARALREIGGVLDRILELLAARGAPLAVPLPADFHLVKLLHLVLEEGGRARDVCQSLCEDLLRLVSGVTADGAADLELSDEGAALALLAFCTADPRLCTPRGNSLRFVTTLLNHLRAQNPQQLAAGSPRFLQYVLAVVDAVLLRHAQRGATAGDLTSVSAKEAKQYVAFVSKMVGAATKPAVLEVCARVHCAAGRTGADAAAEVARIAASVHGFLRSHLDVECTCGKGAGAGGASGSAAAAGRKRDRAAAAAASSGPCCCKRTVKASLALEPNETKVECVKSLFYLGSLFRFGSPLLASACAAAAESGAAAPDLSPLSALRTFEAFHEGGDPLFKALALQALGHVLLVCPLVAFGAGDGPVERPLAEALVCEVAPGAPAEEHTSAVKCTVAVRVSARAE